MELSPLTQADIDGAAAWMRGIPLRADRWRGDDTRSLVATASGMPVAAGMLWTSRVHGDRYWFEIAVAPDHRRRGLGRETFGHLSGLRADDLAFMARGYVDDDRMAFVRALGARTVQIVPPTEIDTSARLELRSHPAVKGAAGVAWDQLEDANAAVYAWTHAAWSPVAADFAPALNEDLADELDTEATSVAVVGGQVVANCMVYRDSDRPIVTAETVSPHTADGERLVEGCVRRARRARRARRDARRVRRARVRPALSARMDSASPDRALVPPDGGPGGEQRLNTGGSHPRGLQGGPGITPTCS